MSDTGSVSCTVRISQRIVSAMLPLGLPLSATDRQGNASSFLRASLATDRSESRVQPRHPGAGIYYFLEFHPLLGLICPGNPSGCPFFIRFRPVWVK